MKSVFRGRRSSSSPGSSPRQAGADAEAESRDLRAAAIGGARSFALSRIAIEATNFFSVIIIARLVDPAEQGRAAIALVVTTLATVLTFEGFGSALVQRRDPRPEHFRTAMTLSVGTGILLTVVVVGVAETVGRHAVGSRAADLIALASPTFVLASLTCVSRATMMRRLAFERMGRNDSLVNLAATAATVGFAIAGFQAKSLIFGALIGAVADLSLQWSYARPVRFGWSRGAARDIAGFGTFASLTGLLNQLRGNIDYIILATLLPARLVGIYFRAFQFGASYQSKITIVFTKMAFPLMSRSKTRAEMRRVRERALEFNAMTALPLLGLLIVLAPQVVPLLYGSQWRDAVLPTQILTVAGMAMALNNGAVGPALALGHSRRVAGFSLFMLVLYAVAVAIGGQFGLIPACAAAAGTYVVTVAIAQYFMVDRLIGLPVTQILADAGPAASATLIAMGVTALVTAGLDHVIGSPATAVVGGLVGLGTFAGVMRVAYPARAKRFFSLVVRVIRPRRDRAPAPAPTPPLPAGVEAVQAGEG